MKKLNFRKLGVSKFPVACIDGPFAGHVLWLDEQRTTLTFTVKGQTGFYKGGRFNAVP